MPATLLSEVVKLSICIITLSIGTGFLQAIEPATGRMGFLAEKLRQGESISAGFLGGSITQGSGASSHSKCYYWLTRTWLSKEAEKRGSSSKSLLAAVGGTNSTYGAFRVGGQLLDKDIDLLIIEFAVNDYSSKEAAAAMEGIVRQAWTRNPQMGIVFLYTTSNRINQTHYAKGDMPPSVRQHHQIAEHYGIVEVNAGKAAATAITDGDYSSQEFFKDGTHPTDIGHAFYAKHLQEALLPLLDLPMPTETPILPVPIVSDRFEYARMLPLSPDDMEGHWTYKEPDYYNYLGRYVTEEPGARVSCSYEGSLYGLLVVKATPFVCQGSALKRQELKTGGRPDRIPVMIKTASLDAAVPEKHQIWIEVPPDPDTKPHVELSALLYFNLPQ